MNNLFGEIAANPQRQFPAKERKLSLAAISPEQLRDEGLARAAEHRREALDLARLVAEMLAHKNGTVTIEEIYPYVSPDALGPAAGAVFRDKKWEFITWVPSRRPSSHARWIRRWRLRADH